jgi:hypothetical protein
MKLIDIYEKGDISPRMSDSVLNLIMESNKIIGIQSKAFAYVFLGVTSYLSINNKYVKHHITLSNIKGFSGYCEKNKKIDYIIKKNGIFEEMGLIKDEKNPFSINTKNHRIKVPFVLDEMENCHTFNLKLFFECMENENLGHVGFLIANYIKENNLNLKLGVRGISERLSEFIGIPSRTIRNYLNEIANIGVIDKIRFLNKDNLKSMNTFLRTKLLDWTENSLNIQHRECFVTGSTHNLIVHHIVPYNEIREFVLNYLDVEDKPISEFSLSELDRIKDLFLEYHKLSIGIPLTEEIHKQFHLQYTSYATLEDLLDFKCKYLSKTLSSSIN